MLDAIIIPAQRRAAALVTRRRQGRDAFAAKYEPPPNFSGRHSVPRARERGEVDTRAADIRGQRLMTDADATFLQEADSPMR